MHGGMRGEYGNKCEKVGSGYDGIWEMEQILTATTKDLITFLHDFSNSNLCKANCSSPYILQINIDLSFGP